MWFLQKYLNVLFKLYVILKKIIRYVDFNEKLILLTKISLFILDNGGVEKHES